MAKHAAAKNLFDRIVSHDAAKVEEFLSLGESILWRELIRYEFNIQSLTNPELLSHPLMLKLIAYDIKTISSLHLASLMGADEILMSLMEKDVPVDLRILSGTSALHLACFAGKVDTVQLLIQVYKADVLGVDTYGWSALHYACAEGHLKVVEILIGLKLDVNARDQDGTTPAFRAQVNGHQNVVRYLLQHGSDDDQLNVEDVSGTLTEAERIAALYTQVNKPKKQQSNQAEGKDAKAGSSGSASEATANGADLKANPLYEHTIVSAPGNLNRSVSEGSEVGSYLTGPKPTKKQARQSSNSVLSRSKTLPSKYKNHPQPSAEKRETIRRIIRKELEMSFGSEYETPVTDSKSTIWEDPELKDIGVKTLTGLMREEFEKYKQEIQPPLEQAPPTPIKNGDDPAYEDLYASLASLPQAPETPDLDQPGPPLPPRNSKGNIFAPAEEPKFIGGHHLTLSTPHRSNPALTESFMRLAPLLGTNWKKLVHVLPLEETPTKVDKRIAAIEKQAPKSPTDQALRSLTEWRVKRGKEANVDSLIMALRKCNMYSLIPEVEMATQEFSA